jgi:hypothetical protein
LINTDQAFSLEISILDIKPSPFEMDFRTRIDPEWKKNLPRDPREFGPKGSPGATPDDRLLVGMFGSHFRYFSVTSSKRAV